MSRVGGLVNTTLDQLGLRRKVLEAEALRKWREVVGPQIAASSRPEKVSEGILFVACKSSAWANELLLHRTSIIARLNKALGRKVIADIRFSARGFRAVPQETPKEEEGGRAKSLEAVPLPEAALEAARSVAAAAIPGELAERIEKAIITSKRRSEVMKSGRVDRSNTEDR